VPVFGRFGHLLTEIATRCRAEVVTIETEWGQVFDPQQIEDAIVTHRPKLLACVQGDTSTTMAQPLEEIGKICRAHDVLIAVDATASLTGMPLDADDWQLDAVTAGLQKCLSGPPGIAPITLNDRAADLIKSRKHIEEGIRPDGYQAADGEMIQSNYFDLAMIMDYWSALYLPKAGRLVLQDTIKPVLHWLQDCVQWISKSSDTTSNTKCRMSRV